LIREALNVATDRAPLETVELATLKEITRAALETRDLNGMLQILADRLGELFNADGCFITLWDESRQVAVPTAAYGPLREAYARIQLDPGERTFSEAVLEAGHVLAIADVRETPYGSPRFTTIFPTKSMLALPLIAGDNWLGAALISYSECHRFTPAEIARGEQVARHIVLAIARVRLLETERQQCALADTLREMASTLNSSLDRAQVLTLILEQLARVIDYDNASLMLLEGDLLQTLAQKGLDAPGSALPPLPSTALRHVHEVLVGRSPGIIPDVRSDTRWLPRPESQHVRCWMGVPLIAQDRVIGLLSLGHVKPGYYTGQHALIARTFADQAAIAIENARLFQAERQRRREAEALRRASLVLGSSLDADWVLGQLLEQIRAVIPYDSANVMAIQDGIVRVTHQRGYERGGSLEDVMALRLPLDAFPNLKQMHCTRRSRVVPDTQTDPGWVSVEPTAWIRSWAGAPIVVRDEVVAFFSLDNQVPGFYGKEHGELLEAFAAHAAVAMENALLFDEAQTAYEELKQAQDQLIQSAKMAAIGQLAAGVAHELNNPLTSILGFAQLLMRNLQPGDPAHDNLSTIAAEALRARDIVQGLLDFSRQNAPFYERVDINQVLRDTLTLVRRQVGHSDVHIVEDYAPDLPPLLVTGGRMKQVFLNLITNALQAMLHGGTLSISSERVKNEIAIRIADTGVGIAEEHLPRLFDPFFSTKPPGQGTGLGLSVSMGIAQEHGGRITVESQPGEGSTFTVWLPAKAAASRQQGSRQ
jgi:signal transduction histidine kinase